jgi:hypothetical protein
MARFFNIAGPCDASRHYMLPPEERLPPLLPLIEQAQYFVVHSARQTGKTTAMLAFAQRLRSMDYVAVWTSLEASQGVESPDAAEPAWLRALERNARIVGVEAPDPGPFIAREPLSRLSSYLATWAAQLDRPLVVLLDEADVVQGAALISLLRQLRDGYTQRGVGRFPTSVALIGMRDPRDYLTAAKDGIRSNPGSPFNIKAESITLRNFTAKDVVALLEQHTADTGQIFTDGAFTEIFRLTEGQPYLVNALARRCVQDLAPDPAVSVTADHVAMAREALILARTTHLDALAERLKEPRVARIVEPIVLGDDAQSISASSMTFNMWSTWASFGRDPTGWSPRTPCIGRSWPASSRTTSRRTSVDRGGGGRLRTGTSTSQR